MRTFWVRSGDWRHFRTNNALARKPGRAKMNPRTIWHADSAAFVCLKAQLQLEGLQRQGWLRCACSGSFQVFLDGKLIGSGPGGELTQVPAWERFEIDTETASPSTSILMVYAASGPDAGWFICEGEMSGATVISDHSWRSLGFPAESVDSIFVEKHSASLWPLLGDGESLPWTHCETPEALPPVNLPPMKIEAVDMAARELVAFGESDVRQTPPMSDLAPLTNSKCVNADGLLQGHGLSGTTIRTPAASMAVCVLLDFGRQVHGTPILSMQADSAGGVVDLFFGEIPDRFDSAIRYICCAGRQRWTGLYSHSFRFVMARFSEFSASDCSVEQIGVRVRRPGRGGDGKAAERGTIEGDARLEALWEVGKKSIDTNRQQIYRIEAHPTPYDWLSALPLFLNDCSHHGDSAAGLAMLVSAGQPRDGATDLRRWLGYPLFLESYLQYSADHDTVSDCLATAFAVTDLVQEQRQSSGLLPAIGPLSASRATITAAGAARAASRLFDVFSMERESRATAECFDSLLESTLSCWSEERQLYHEGDDETAYTQLTNALALRFGLVDDARQEQILTAMRGPGVEAVRGLNEAFYLVDGLWQARAYRRAMQSLQIHWGRRLERKGSTWLDKRSQRERPAGGVPGPDYFLSTRIVGLRPAAIGVDGVEIEPAPAGIDHMSAELPTRYGNTHVEWWRPETQQTCRLEVRTEQVAMLRMCMPRLGIRFPEISVNDQTVWRNDKVVPNPWVHEIDAERDRIVLTVSGTGPFAAQVS